MKNAFIKIKYRVKLNFFSILFKLRFEKKLLKNRYGERILVFHGIDKIGETKYNSRFISKDYFEELMQYFKENFNVVSLDDFYAKKFKKNTLNIAITFDDGYENNYKYAVPILEKLKLPATFFVTTIPESINFLWADFLDLVSVVSTKRNVSFLGNLYKKNIKNEFLHKSTSLKNKCKHLEYNQIEILFSLFSEEWDCITKHHFNDYYKLMSKSQLLEISKNSLFKIGAHGFYHTNLASITKGNAFYEIEKSKEKIEEICQTNCNSFAFPFGTYSNELINYCKAQNFNQILLVDYNYKVDKTDQILKPRFGINPYISKKMQLLFLLKGTYI